MSWPGFRFIHASDLHLELPAQGLAEIPQPLEHALLEAPYLAASAVIEHAISHEVDFVVLSGHVLNPLTTGPRGPVYLVEQFHRLAEQDIEVYWATGSIDDADRWPHECQLPENVHRFDAHDGSQFVHRRKGQAVAQLVGKSRIARRKIRADEFLVARNSEFTSERNELFTIAVAHGSLDEPERSAQSPINYWALGGKHARGTQNIGRATMHYPGTAQGRSLEETGSHFCSLVEVEGYGYDDHGRIEHGNVEITPLSTDALRWHDETVTVARDMTRGDLHELVRHRIDMHRHESPGMPLLIAWTLAGSARWVSGAERSGLAAELLGWLRQEFSGGHPPVWSIGVRCQADPLPKPEDYSEDDLLNDFLQEVQALESVGDEAFELSQWLGGRKLDGDLRELLDVPDAAARQRIMRQAGALGIRLLSGEEATR